MGVMARFNGTRLHPSVTASLEALLGHRPTILAWAEAADGWAVGLTGAMLVSHGESWRSFAWHQVTTGQWDSPSGRLTWVDADGTAHEALLRSGGRFADLFNERVTASVVVTRRVELQPGRQITLALRRNLEPGSDETQWQVIPGPRVDLDDPATQARVDQELAAALADFGLA